MDATIRPSTPADLELHVRHREAMFRDMEMGDEAGTRRMSDEFRALLRTWLVTGQVRGFVAEAEGVPVAGALLKLKETVPTPLSPLSVRGYLFNVYTEPAHRGRGLARKLTEAAVEACRELGLEILELHASLAAEPLYKAMGFQPTSEYRMILGSGLAVPKQWVGRR